MIEIDLEGVHRSDLDKLGDRPYARYAVRHLGVQCPDFCKRACDLLGEPFSWLRLLTGGRTDPSGLVCSDIVTRCLPPNLVERVHDWLKPRHPLASTRIGNSFLISPNGYALAFGAPRGRDVDLPNFELAPLPFGLFP
jgi:hypothetical protein